MATEITNSPDRLTARGRSRTSHVHDGTVSMPSAVTVDTIAGTNIAGYSRDHDGEKCRNAAAGPSIRNGYDGTATHHARKMMLATISTIRPLDLGCRAGDATRGSDRGDHCLEELQLRLPVIGDRERERHPEQHVERHSRNATMCGRIRRGAFCASPIEKATMT